MVIIILVDKILATKDGGKNTAVFEEEIDRKVYELYGLSEEEINFIENNAQA